MRPLQWRPFLPFYSSCYVIRSRIASPRCGLCDSLFILGFDPFYPEIRVFLCPAIYTKASFRQHLPTIFTGPLIRRDRMHFFLKQNARMPGQTFENYKYTEEKLPLETFSCILPLLSSTRQNGCNSSNDLPITQTICNNVTAPDGVASFLTS